ncbi:MAG: NifU family protein [Alphaproteobacteria bacterium]
MFIQTEPTPNPSTLKFLPGRPVMGQGTADFPTAEKAHQSPLADRLFQVDGVRSVFLGSDFVSVTKADGREWREIKPMVLGAMVEHFVSGQPTVLDGTHADGGGGGGDDEVVAKIKSLLDTRIRPAVAQDGGDIVFREFRDGIVYLRMQGACSGCPSSTATLKNGIENMMRHFVPEVRGVRAVD